MIRNDLGCRVMNSQLAGFADIKVRVSYRQRFVILVLRGNYSEGRKSKKIVSSISNPQIRNGNRYHLGGKNVRDAL